MPRELDHDDATESALHPQQRGGKTGEGLASESEGPDANEARERRVAEDQLGQGRGRYEGDDADPHISAADDERASGDDGIPLCVRPGFVVISEHSAEEPGAGHHREEIEAHLDQLDRPVLRWSQVPGVDRQHDERHGLAEHRDGGEHHGVSAERREPEWRRRVGRGFGYGLVLRRDLDRILDQVCGRRPIRARAAFSAHGVRTW